jgi:flavin prenyltransferase
MSSSSKIIVGITGATGAPVACDFLRRCPGEKQVVASAWGKKLFADETGIGLSKLVDETGGELIDNQNFMAPICSGGMPVNCMIILPCSSNTMGKIAAGIADSVLTRAAHVTMKEQRRLILVVREAPWATIDLENALKLSRAGVSIVPLSPMWYFNPTNLDELISAFTDRLIEMCGGPVGRVWPEGVR